MTDAALPDWPALMDEVTAAAYLSLSPRTLRTLIARGRLRAARMDVKVVRFRRRDLDAYVDNLPLREAKDDAAADAGLETALRVMTVDEAEEGLRRVEAMGKTRRRHR